MKVIGALLCKIVDILVEIRIPVPSTNGHRFPQTEPPIRSLRSVPESQGIGPASGPGRLIFGFEAVIIGGLGSLWGTLAGGIILGVSQAIGAQINPGWQLLAGHLAFLLILALRPEGLFPKVKG